MHTNHVSVGLKVQGASCRDHPFVAFWFFKHGSVVDQFLLSRFEDHDLCVEDRRVMRGSYTRLDDGVMGICSISDDHQRVGFMASRKHFILHSCLKGARLKHHLKS